MHDISLVMAENEKNILENIGEQEYKYGFTTDIETETIGKGLSEEVNSTIVKMSPQRVVYVSCDPGPLARDMKLFSRLGYAPQTGTAVDMFPKCAHVECVVLMSRVKE